MKCVNEPVTIELKNGTFEMVACKGRPLAHRNADDYD